MSSLTEEQKKKIEENRKRALERRAEILKSRAVNNAFNTKPQVSLGVKNTCNTLNSTNKNKWNNASSSSMSCKAFNKDSSSNKLILYNKNIKCVKTSMNENSKPENFYSLHQKTSDHSSVTSDKSTSISEVKSVFTGKKITGNFSLISTNRFIVNIPYQVQAIEIFKTIPSKQYDMNSKRWDFDIVDHGKLATSLHQLRPAVCVSPLPNYVLQALKKTYPAPGSIDLMCVDPLLLEAFMPFQREGVCFGVSRNGRVLIADDMGLGKTIQALGIASYYRNEWPMLIVTPSSVRYAWAEAVQRWISSVSSYEVVVMNSTKDVLEGIVIIMSYDMLSRRAQELKDMNFQFVIMDESHMLKNFKSARYKSALPIMKSSKRVVLLTGTPALSRPSELYTQLSAVDAKLFPNFQDYGLRYCAAKQQPWGWDYSGSSNMEELQIILTSTLMIRRLKSEVISQLPPKQRMSIILDPSSIKSKTKVMQAMANELKRTNLKSAEKQGALLQMFRETAFAKVKAVCDYIKELLVEGEKKFLVFAHHRVMMNKISDVCEELKVRYIRIDGSTASESRQTLVDHFQTTEDVRVAVLSITAASTGITLTAAQLVVFAELYWNPGPLVQAEDRAHRIGQEDSVLVQYLVAKDTADDYIWPLVKEKLNILGKAGLSKEDFNKASCANQKVNKDEGIMKYFSQLDDKVFEEEDEKSSRFSSSIKRRKLSEEEEHN